jgi:hypothetical protein
MEELKVLVIVALSTALYFGVLLRKNIVTFKKDSIKINLYTSFLITILILMVHVRIAWENKNDYRFVLFAFRQFFLRYDMALVTLLEVVKCKELYSVSNNKIKRKTKVSNWLGSKSVRKEYSNILEHECFA